MGPKAMLLLSRQHLHRHPDGLLAGVLGCSAVQWPTIVLGCARAGLPAQGLPTVVELGGVSGHFLWLCRLHEEVVLFLAGSYRCLLVGNPSCTDHKPATGPFPWELAF